MAGAEGGRGRRYPKFQKIDHTNTKSQNSNHSHDPNKPKTISIKSKFIGSWEKHTSDEGAFGCVESCADDHGCCDAGVFFGSSADADDFCAGEDEVFCEVGGDGCCEA